jgi:hypothetical protein
LQLTMYNLLCGMKSISAPMLGIVAVAMTSCNSQQALTSSAETGQARCQDDLLHGRAGLLFCKSTINQCLPILHNFALPECASRDGKVTVRLNVFLTSGWTQNDVYYAIASIAMDEFSDEPHAAEFCYDSYPICSCMPTLGGQDIISVGALGFEMAEWHMSIQLIDVDPTRTCQFHMAQGIRVCRTSP